MSGFLCFKWCLQESNQGHMDFQSIALPTELRHQDIKRLQIYILLHYIQTKREKKAIVFFVFPSL